MDDPFEPVIPDELYWEHETFEDPDPDRHALDEAENEGWYPEWDGPEPYDLNDPKHPDHHDVFATLADEREEW